MPDHDVLPSHSGVRRRVLACPTCKRTADCPPADLRRFARDGWPRCCGEVMALAVAPAETDPRSRA